jgi:acyl carrier protein
MEDSLQIKEKIRQFIVKSCYVEDDLINNDTLIFEQGIMDSMGFMSLISFIEESFSLQVTENDLLETNFESIDAVTGFVEKKLHFN